MMVRKRKVSEARQLVADVRFTAASTEDVERGLFGWVSCLINGTLCLDGLAVRRTLDGRLVLSFPARTDGAGRQHFYVRPLDDCARREIEEAVFRALGLEQVKTS